MLHFCIFGAHEGELSSDKRVYITICGGCELKRPTLARQLIEQRERGSKADPGRWRFFFTLFGATELKAPTLAEEFIDLQDALRAELLTVDEWDRGIARLRTMEGLSAASFTVCGGFSTNELPTEDEELDRLALNKHLGNISDSAGRALMLAVGHDGSQRPTAVRRAVAEQAAA
jgi:hypothetical protein